MCPFLSCYLHCLDGAGQMVGRREVGKGKRILASIER